MFQISTSGNCIGDEVYLMNQIMRFQSKLRLTHIKAVYGAMNWFKAPG